MRRGRVNRRRDDRQFERRAGKVSRLNAGSAAGVKALRGDIRL